LALVGRAIDTHTLIFLLVLKYSKKSSTADGSSTPATKGPTSPLRGSSAPRSADYILTEKKEATIISIDISDTPPAKLTLGLFKDKPRPSIPSAASRCCSTAISSSYPPHPGVAPSHKEISSAAQNAQALGKALYVCLPLHHSHFIRTGDDPAPAGRPTVQRSAQPSADGPHDGRRCAVPQHHPLRRPGSRCRNPQHSCGLYSRAHSSTRLLLLGATTTHGHGRPLLRK